MKYYVVLVVISLLVLTGCSNTNIVDIEKDEYLSYKEEILTTNDFTDKEDLMFNIDVITSKISPEELSYKLVINNAKEDMHDVKVLMIHNKLTDNVFPSLGIFDNQSISLLTGDTDKDITLIGTIKTTKNINDIDIEYKVYIEYKNSLNETVKVYYKTTN